MGEIPGPEPDDGEHIRGQEPTADGAAEADADAAGVVDDESAEYKPGGAKYRGDRLPGEDDAAYAARKEALHADTEVKDEADKRFGAQKVEDRDALMATLGITPKPETVETGPLMPEKITRGDVDQKEDREQRTWAELSEIEQLLAELSRARGELNSFETAVSSLLLPIAVEGEVSVMRVRNGLLGFTPNAADAAAFAEAVGFVQHSDPGRRQELIHSLQRRIAVIRARQQVDRPSEGQ